MRWHDFCEKLKQNRFGGETMFQDYMVSVERAVKILEELALEKRARCYRTFHELICTKHCHRLLNTFELGICKQNTVTEKYAWE